MGLQNSQEGLPSLALLPLPGRPGLPSGSSLGSLSIHKTSVAYSLLSRD